MPAGFSTLAPDAERRCGRNPAIAARSARMAQFHARRCKLSVQVRRRYRLLRAVESDDRPRGSKLGRLAANPRANLLALWIPQAAIVAGLFASVAARVAIWIVALTWMGTACILNAKRCGRTHCRYTGPYYLAMIAPTFALGFSFPSVSSLGWLILAFVILLGSKLLWWGSERAWGKYSRRP
jgi:hypothetical protein